MTARILVITALLSLPNALNAKETAGSGQVQIPIDVYTQLVNDAADPSRPAPAQHALGRADVKVNVNEVARGATAVIDVTLALRILEGAWTLVPILPSGTGIVSATVGGEAVDLTPTPRGLAWITNAVGKHSMQLRYNVDARRSGGGFSLALPTPQAAVTKLDATLPGSNLDVAVIPSSGAKVTPSGGTTQVSAAIPTTSGVQLSWTLPTDRGHTISRASYSGELQGDAVAWRGEFAVELFGTESVTLPLLPQSVTLTDLRVDGKAASILVEAPHFATIIKGRGNHSVSVRFEVPVVRSDGPPSVTLQVPPVPVSRFDLVLPGKKEVTANPAASVQNRVRGGTTTATLFVPMTSQITLTWNEAIPEEIKEELRTNASVYHAAHAEEGVLYVHAMVVYEVTRGQTNVIRFATPSDIEINEVSAAAGGVADWRRTPAQRGKPSTLNVFLDRQLDGELTFDVRYEKLIGTGSKATEKLNVPLLDAVGVHRQRGMVALLSSKELTLKPIEEKDAARVGENQLPAFVRQQIDKTIAHTFKYVETLPRLVAQAATPERKEGKFDAQVDTLVSLGDVTLKGAATLEINVKSGGIQQLDLELPPNVNFLNLTAPSMRTHKVESRTDGQTVNVQFTQEMDGQFRVEVTYERILADGENEVSVPTLRVVGAEVEQGRIAVEALTAVEVKASKVEQLSSLDMTELPQQLILKTTNPILLAYKYVHADPPYALTLAIARHRELDVQTATIDRAHYRTLFTRDGLAVTTAQFTVRNSRKQFLKIELPPNSQVWSAFVDGKAEKPALAEQAETDGKAPSSVLLKIINSAEGFPVDLIYATPVSKVGPLGKITSRLPRPDMVVTESQWDVYLPDGLSYGTPDATMEIGEVAVAMTREAMAAEVGQLNDRAAGAQLVAPLRISVPTAGVRFSFSKLYANQSDAEAEFSIPYASGGGALLAQLLTLLAALLLWAGVYLTLRPDVRVPRNVALGGIGLGLVLVLVTVGYLGTSPAMAIGISILFVGALGARLAFEAMRRRRAQAADSTPSP